MAGRRGRREAEAGERKRAEHGIVLTCSRSERSVVRILPNWSPSTKRMAAEERERGEGEGRRCEVAGAALVSTALMTARVSNKLS